MKKLKVLGSLLVITLLGGLLAELALRELRYDEFPVFEISGDIGYLPAPNQAGVFAGRHLWLVNKHGQQNGPFFADNQKGLLLLGDSLTWGGVGSYDHTEKLGSALQNIWPERHVWSAGAGSWALLNQLAYLERFPEVADGVRDIVFISNSADFSMRSRSLGELQHPSRRPLLVSVYLARKWMSTRWPRVGDKDVVWPVPTLQPMVAEEWRQWMAAARKKSIRVTVLWYPTRDELTDPRVAVGLRDEVEKMVVAGGAQFGCLDAHAGWGDTSQYRDDIHPSAEGNGTLARSIKMLLEHLWSNEASRSD